MYLKGEIPRYDVSAGSIWYECVLSLTPYSARLKNRSQILSGVHQMRLPFPFISWVNRFPNRFVNRSIFFCNVLKSHECTCRVLFDLRRYYCHFSISIGSFLYQRAKPPQGTVLFIDLFGKGLTPGACMGDGASICWTCRLGRLPKYRPSTLSGNSSPKGC